MTADEALNYRREYFGAAEPALAALADEVVKLRADNEWLRSQAKQNEDVRAEQAKQLRGLIAENEKLKQRLQSLHEALIGPTSSK